MMLNQLAFKIKDIHKAYSEGVTASDVVNESLRRIDSTADEGIYLYMASQQQLSQAISELGKFDPEDKPLWGIPFAVKDNIDVAGMSTTAACPAFSYLAKEDAYVVSLLKRAGAIVIGKTNLDQFATGLVGVRTPYPAPKNAVNPDYVPGGSSSGSAVTVAHEHVVFSLGTDTAGSGRIPAALNNIVGLKPSLGSLSNRGVLPACRTLDTISVFSTTVEDAAKVFDCCAVHDPLEPFSKSYSFEPHTLDVNNLTLAIPNTETIEFDDESQKKAFYDAVTFWQDSGVNIVEIDFSLFYEVAELLYDGPWVAERKSALMPFIDDHPQDIHPITLSIINKATHYSASDLFTAQYHLQTLKMKVSSLMEGIDGLCTPSMPGFVTLEQVADEPIKANSRLGTYTNFVNLLDMCAITVPGPSQDNGLPSSITLVSQGGSDRKVREWGSYFCQNHRSL